VPAARMQAEQAVLQEMLDWDDLRYFLAIQRAGNLARAATSLGINATTVGRRLGQLEERLKARLFDRTAEGYLLTPVGRDLMPRAERMESEILAVARELVGRDERPAGSVRLSATEMIATRFIAPHLPRFGAQYPELTLELECTHRNVSLSRREADVALRLARPHEDDVVTRRLASVPLALYASRRYAQQHGLPEDPESSLRGHAAILFAGSRLFALENEWLTQRLDGAPVVLRSDSVSSIYAATVAGLGIALLPRAVADLDEQLLRLHTATSPEPRAIWQAVHVDLQRSARVRAVLGFLEEVIERAAPDLAAVPPERVPFG
jgi:DNA-binding transcriptional LysR family regulator